MKKKSLLLMIISSLGIVIGQSLFLLNESIFSQKMTAVSFIGLGVGAILFGIYKLRCGSEDLEKK